LTQHLFSDKIRVEAIGMGNVLETIVSLINEKKTVIEIAVELRVTARHAQRLIASAVRAGLLPARPVGRPAAQQDDRNRRRRDRHALKRLAEVISKPSTARDIFASVLAELPAPARAEALAWVRGGDGDGRVVHSLPPAGEGSLVAAALAAVEWYRRSRLRTGSWGPAPRVAREFLDAVAEYERKQKELDRRAREVSIVVNKDPFLAAADAAAGLAQEALARFEAAEEKAREAAKAVAAALLNFETRTIWPSGGEIGISFQDWEQEIAAMRSEALAWAKTVEAAARKAEEPQTQAGPQPQAPEPGAGAAGRVVRAKDALDQVDRDILEVLAEDQARGREHHAEAVGISRPERFAGNKPIIT
jgi:hypothetical protein